MKTGFSLIELLVSIGIVMIIFSAGIASYRTATRNQALDTDVALIIQVLNIAKTNVNSGKKIVCITQSLKNWQVEFKSSTFELQEICVDNSININNTYTLSSKNTITANPTIIKFQALGQGATLGTIIVGTKTITVNSVGIIQLDQ